jgi:prepilin-type N-terminal cleavage/methylation domain-containing protein
MVGTGDSNQRISFTCHTRGQGSRSTVLHVHLRRLKPELQRRGFTLFEVLLVMAVMVMILSLGWPVVERYHSEYRLRQGGLLIQSRLSSARVHAIDTGVPYEFRYEPGGQRFLVLPHDLQALQAQQVPGSHGPAKVAGKLPSPQAHFDANAPGATGGQSISAEWLTGIAAAAEFADATWSAPILFYPDGTSAHATLHIIDKKSQSVTVSVRPLTGAVSVSKITRGTSR